MRDIRCPTPDAGSEQTGTQKPGGPLCTPRPMPSAAGPGPVGIPPFPCAARGAAVPWSHAGQTPRGSAAAPARDVGHRPPAPAHAAWCANRIFFIARLASSSVSSSGRPLPRRRRALTSGGDTSTRMAATRARARTGTSNRRRRTGRSGKSPAHQRRASARRIRLARRR